MQETRLNLLFNLALNSFRNFFTNPWRKLALIFILLLLGFFMAPAISTTVGQAAEWDINIAAIFLVFTEVSSIIAYRRRAENGRSLVVDLLNSFKIGFVYGLYLEALKLSS
jgi:hypothetical protein